MQTEIEAKFLYVNFDELRAKLTALDAVCEQPMRMMKRAIFEPRDGEKYRNGYIRVRDEGHRTTITYKQIDVFAVDGAKEIETTVGSFDKAVALLEAFGIECRSIQESKRETWKVGDVEVVLDEWPWLQPYIEVEGESVEAIRDVSERLGFSWSDAVFGDVMVAYRAQYPHLGPQDTVGNLPEVKFGMLLPEMFKEKCS